VPQIQFYPSTAFVGGTPSAATTVQGQAAGVKDHTFREPSVCALNPPSFPIAEDLECGASTQTKKLYAGGCLTTVELTINDLGWIDLKVDGITDGTETTIATFSFPATETQVTALLGNMVTTYLGTSYTDAILPGELASLSIKVDTGAAAIPRITSSTYVVEVQYGAGKPSVDIDMAIKGDKASRYWILYNQGMLGQKTKFKCVIDPMSTPQRRVTVTCDQCTIVSADLGKNGKEPQLKIKLAPEGNSVDQGKITWVCQTSQATYNVAA
jgi:hypothetical protein